MGKPSLQLGYYFERWLNPPEPLDSVTLKRVQTLLRQYRYTPEDADLLIAEIRAHTRP